MVFCSILAGVVAGLTMLFALVPISAELIHQHAETLTVSALLGYVTADALCAMLVGGASALLTLYVLIRAFRGNSAVGFSMPSECTSLAAWAYSRWQFYGRGPQDGLRVFGLEIALKGQVA